MFDPSKRVISIILALGILALLAGIALGEREGDRVIGQVTEKRLESVAPVTVTPAPVKTAANPYGPNWKRTSVMAAAPDPGFPDPRVPPVAPPTPTPEPKFKIATPLPVASPTPTPNMNVPIWRRLAPMPTATPPGGTATPSPSGSPSPSPSPEPQQQP